MKKLKTVLEAEKTGNAVVFDVQHDTLSDWGKLLPKDLYFAVVTLKHDIMKDFVCEMYNASFNYSDKEWGEFKSRKQNHELSFSVKDWERVSIEKTGSTIANITILLENNLVITAST